MPPFPICWNATTSAGAASSFPFTTTAAGAIVTSVAALANWMKFLLAEGEFEGKRLLSPSSSGRCRRPASTSARPNSRSSVHAHYGLGFRSSSYRGERMVGHSGGWLGWSTLMRLVPERKLGIAVFTNTGGNPLPAILINRIHDHLAATAPVPWLDRLRDMRRKALAQQKSDDAARPAARKPNTKPSHDLADFCGAYEHPAYGRVVITQDGDSLHWAWRGTKAPLSHRHYDSFQLPFVYGELNPDRSRHLPSRPTATATSRASRPSSSRWSPTSSSPAPPSGECMDACLPRSLRRQLHPRRADPRRHGGCRGSADAEDPVRAALPAASPIKARPSRSSRSTATAPNSAAARPAPSTNSSSTRRTAPSSPGGQIATAARRTD